MEMSHIAPQGNVQEDVVLCKIEKWFLELWVWFFKWTYRFWAGLVADPTVVVGISLSNLNLAYKIAASAREEKPRVSSGRNAPPPQPGWRC